MKKQPRRHLADKILLALASALLVACGLLCAACRSECRLPDGTLQPCKGKECGKCGESGCLCPWPDWPEEETTG